MFVHENAFYFETRLDAVSYARATFANWLRMNDKIIRLDLGYVIQRRASRAYVGPTS